MSPAEVDHLVLAAATLDQGVAWCEATLGITPGAGGKHPLMGTHNRLFKIAGDEFPQAYFEILAVDPDAPAPQRCRWFGLDEIDLSGGPRLIHVVARSNALQAQRNALLALGLQPGEPIRAGRDTPAGPLSWQILVRADGRLNCGGALPTLIQWDGWHPAEAMPESGVRLKSLALNRVPDAAREVLRLRGVAVSSAPGPALLAVLSTARGDVTLHST